MCYSLFAALFSKTFLSHPPFKPPGSAPGSTKLGAIIPKVNSTTRWIFISFNRRKNSGKVYTKNYTNVARPF